MRFAAGLPPTRQSRFGGEEEESVYRPCSPKEAQLLRGSAISPNYRRRQVNRLMNMQQSSVDSWTSSSSPQQSLESTGSLSSSLERGGEEDTDGVSMLPFLSLRCDRFFREMTTKILIIKIDFTKFSNYT